MQVFSYIEPSYWDIVSNKIYIKWTPLCGVRTHENYLILITDSTSTTRHNWKFKFIFIPGKWHQFEYRVTRVTMNVPVICIYDLFTYFCPKIFPHQTKFQHVIFKYNLYKSILQYSQLDFNIGIWHLIFIFMLIPQNCIYHK